MYAISVFFLGTLFLGFIGPDAVDYVKLPLGLDLPQQGHAVELGHLEVGDQGGEGLGRAPQRGQGALWDRLADRIIELTGTQGRRLGWIGGLMAGSVLFTVLLWPESNYLPPVKRDTVDSFLFFPPGTNIETADREIAQLLPPELDLLAARAVRPVSR